MNNIILLCFFFSWNTPLWAGWLDRKAEGWAWYEDIEKKTEKKEEVPTIEPQPLPLIQQEPKKSPLEELAEVKKEVEEKLATAVLNPTEQNVVQYMTIQKKWIDQSGQFAKIWSKILLNYPELDETAKNFPVSQYGIQLKKQMLQEKKENLIKQLAKDNGLFFFYEGKNKTSIVFSSVVKEFAKRYGWQVIAISMDEVAIEGFMNNKVDNGISKSLNVKIFPSLFIVNPQTHEVVPISFGLSSIDQIENNVEMQFQSIEEENQ